MTICCPKSRYAGAVLGGSALVFASGSLYSNYNLVLPLDEASGDFLDRVGSHNGTRHNTVLDDGAYCLPSQHFNGLAWITTEMVGGSAFSTSMLARIETNHQQGVWFSQDNIAIGYSFLNRLRVIYKTQLTTHSVENHEIWGDTTLTKNEFHYVSLVYDGNTVMVYLDGELEISTVIGATTAPDVITLGRHDGALMPKGNLQEFRYSYSLLPSAWWDAEWSNYSDCDFIS